MDTQRLVRKIDEGSGYDLFLSENGFVSARFNGTNVLRVDFDTLYSSRLGEWMHVAATYDGSRIRIYIDGEEDGSEPAVFAVATNDEELRIGSDIGCEDAYDGLIDDVRIYPRALSIGEIRTLACLSSGLTLFISGADRDPPGNVVLSIDDPNLPEDVSHRDIFRSSDPAIPYEEWPVAELNVVDADPVTPGIQWTDDSGDLSPSGTWYYRAIACEKL